MVGYVAPKAVRHFSSKKNKSLPEYSGSSEKKEKEGKKSESSEGENEAKDKKKSEKKGEKSEGKGDISTEEKKQQEDSVNETKVEEHKEETSSLENSQDVIVSVATATEKQLDDIFSTQQNNPPFNYTPNTLEHKAQRWAQYKIEKGEAAKGYSAWSNIYNANMTKANKANKVADEVMASIGWGQREVSVQAGSSTRRMDIADKTTKKGVEVKSYETGKVYATSDIKAELEADKFLIEDDFWEIEWVFKGCEPSNPLKNLLENAGITIKYIP